MYRLNPTNMFNVFGKEAVEKKEVLVESSTPKGLTYVKQFISPEYQAELMQFIEKQEWDTSISRRTQHYGYRYNYQDKSAETKLGEIPKVFDGLRKSLTEHFGTIPTQVIINEYKPKQGIASHVDHVKYFGPVVASISLLSSLEMELNRGQEKHCQILHPGSALILSDESRYKWSHQIRPREYDVIDGVEKRRSRRVSITFRTMNSQ